MTPYVKTKTFGKKKNISVEAGRVTVSLSNILKGCRSQHDYTVQKHHSFATTSSKRNLICALEGSIISAMV